MQLYMIRRRSAWADQEELEKTAALSGDDFIPIAATVVVRPDPELV